ncbi:DUF3347 domain-containing protein [Chitinophaga arvensicola]|uniref:DUF3347 domain-containing protein n=1 Tax=Chitinophaga arvensicola TaxID=29529 RepID=A0A1I0S7J8_9BACT|nr:DUF3347 domain-containing protein [Chitinophaga arvensicola]SEW51739.1 Protein of unknown function [Chitinophaga arvensicola]
MKTMMLGALAIAAVIFTACNQPEKKAPETTTNVAASTEPAATPQTSNAAPQKVSAIKAVVDNYLAIKNGLADEQPSAVANAGTAMAAALEVLDHSSFTPAQEKIFKENEDDLKEHATHISKSAAHIDHQREHFVQMSDDVYALVKAFGGGQTLYYDHCPMYNENKGASWLSEIKDIKNPYMGAKMSGCGSVKEVIQ